MTTHPLTTDLQFKRGDDFDFGIDVTDGDEPANLTGYTVRCQLRYTSEESDTVVTPTLDDGDFAIGRANYTIPRATAEAMAPGVWVVDFEATSDKRRSSRTFTVRVIPDVTR
jgi:hypothetical protein